MLTVACPGVKPVQVMVTPDVEEVAAKVTAVVVQVKVAGTVTTRFGLVISCTTVTLSMVLQPVVPRAVT
jgi:hypothetical protein